MSRKYVGTVLALVMIATLILAACAPAEPEVIVETVVVETEVEKVVTEVVEVEKEVEKIVTEVVETEVETVVTATPAPTEPEGTVVVGVWQEPKGLIWNIFYQAHTNDILDSMYYAPVALDENDELIP